jgi:hypothetical protein
VWCGFDENLEQGARCKRQLNHNLNSCVFVEDFAAKLPTAPQLTVLEHSSPSSRCQNINLLKRTMMKNSSAN